MVWWGTSRHVSWWFQLATSVVIRVSSKSLGECLRDPTQFCVWGEVREISLEEVTGKLRPARLDVLDQDRWVLRGLPRTTWASLEVSKWLWCNSSLCMLMGCGHGILQARILKGVAMPSSRGSSWPRDWTLVSRIADGFFTIWATREACDFDKEYYNRDLAREEIGATCRI